jgi:beta-mannanase/uncharacterized protein YjdB
MRNVSFFVITLISVLMFSTANAQGKLCNPNATPQTKQLMAYLDSLYSKKDKILSGHCNDSYLPYINEVTGGKSPAMMVYDFNGICPSQGGNFDVPKAIDYYKNKGGIVGFQWHWISPDADGDYYGNFNLGAALANKNGQSYKNIIRDIDLVAASIKTMQDAGVPILFRPLHEAEGKWFWWGRSGGAATKELYLIMYDRLVNYHKLNNIIWVWNSYGTEKENWYPGDNVVDIIAWDYANANSWNEYQQLFGNKGKMFALAEEGTIPNPNNIKNNWWLYFVTWDYMIADPDENSKGKNQREWLKQTYNDPRVITLDELPKWGELVAAAGVDQLILDIDRSGSELVILDGTGSSSITGNITYNWSENGVKLSTQAKPTLNLTEGIHNIILTVSNGINSVSDIIVVTIKTPSLAYKKPITVSSTEVGANVPANAVDGNSATRWSSLYSDPQSITLDLQSTYIITSVVLSWEVASAKNYTVEVSTDGVTFSNPIATKNNMPTGARIDNITGLNSAARYVRISGTARTSAFGYSLYEFEVYGENPIKVESVSLNKTSTEIKSGATEQLAATVLPINATNKKVSWSTSNPTIATVDAQGIVTAKEIGTCIVTATSTTDGTIKASCTVNVIFSGFYKLVATSGVNGTISPNGTTNVAVGASTTFIITPATNYNIATLKVDGVTVPSALSFTFANVTANHTIEVSFVIITPVNLVNPNATPETRAVKAYLDEVYGKKIISGQAFENVNENWLDIINTASKGKQPAILGLDFMNSTYDRRTKYGADPNAMTDKAIDWYKNKHGLVEFHWHWDAPKNVTGVWYQAFYSKNTSFDINYAMNNQNSEDFKLLVRDIDDVAAQLKRLQDAGVPVIWRPLHEAEGGWFWWGNKDGASLQKLWNFMYDRLTNYHKLNNLIWVWNSYGGGNKGNWYPGDNTVDIIAWDYEASNSWSSYQNLFGGKKKLFALGEEGKLPDPNNFNARPWLYFLTWAYMIKDNNSTDWIYSVYNNPKTITLSDLPWPWVKDVVADAGSNQNITTTESLVSVNLIGSKSTSVNGAIISYVWMEKGLQIAIGATPTVNLALGTHNITLVVTDNTNKTATSSVVVSVKLPNIALNKPITVSSTEATYGNIATFTNDGNSTTRWSSLYTDPQMITIDLLDSYAISSIVLNWEVANAKAYSIEFSLDGITWNSIANKTGMPVGARIDSVLNVSQNARYVRVVLTQRNTVFGYSLYEIEIYGIKIINAQTLLLFKSDNATFDEKTDIENVQENSSKQALLYPNPATNYITLQLENFEIKNTIIIVNTLGQKVLTQNVVGPDINLNIENLPNGVYYLYVNSFQTKFIVKK